MGFVFIIKDLSCSQWWTVVTLATSLKEGNINFHQAQPKLLQVGRRFVERFVSFMSILKDSWNWSLSALEMSRFDKNEFDNNMSNLSECWKGGPDTWSNNVDKTHTPLQPTHKCFKYFWFTSQMFLRPTLLKTRNCFTSAGFNLKLQSFECVCEQL